MTAAGASRGTRLGERAETAEPVEPAETAAPAEPGFSATYVTEVDIAGALPRLGPFTDHSGRRYGSARVLVRWAGEPLGVAVVPLPDGGLAAGDLASMIWSALGDRIGECAPGHDGLAAGGIPPEGIPPAPAGAHSARLSAALVAAPMASIVLCTRGRREGLRRSLAALAAQDYPAFEIVVVDNAPTSDDVATAVSEVRGSVPVRRVVEPAPGLARARNRGWREARGSILAFVDDDEVPDAHWLAELALGFRAGDRVGCVTGPVMTAELETRAQALFEAYGGHSKGRGFREMLFDPAVRGGQHPLYPLPPFGAGGNMAFTRQALSDIGGFDPALGAGTPSRAGEDTAAFADVMLRGYQLAFRPRALVWHYQRAEESDLADQLFGYGAGLTTYFLHVLRRHPSAIMDLVKLAPEGLRDLLSPRSKRFTLMAAPMPRAFLAAHAGGMLWGLVAYPSTVWKQRDRHSRTRPAA